MLRALSILLLSLGFTACSGMRLIDTHVRAASSLSDPASLQGVHYKFERSPLQPSASNTADSASQSGIDALETQAEQALNQLGLVRDEAQATHTILLSLQLTPYLVDRGSRIYGAPSPWVYGIRGSRRLNGYGPVYGYNYGLGWNTRFPPTTLYRHQLKLIMRDSRNGKLGYASQAWHDGPWVDDKILPVLLSAALKNFPESCTPECLVNIEIPR